jgi:V8-like Glu-specific endopeptidase
MTLDELAESAPVPATGDMPEELREMLDSNSGPFVRSASPPKLDFATAEVPGAPGMWRIIDNDDEELHTTIPGREQTELTADDVTEAEGVSGTDGYRPPWVPLEHLPRLTPFRADGGLFFEPRAVEETNRLAYPQRTVGIVFSSNGFRGSGVLVGPNLLLTAGHVAPWGQSPWSMEFIPAFREGNRPFGSSFVEAYRGFNTTGEVSGKDYVICKLFNPLGNAVGWMGTTSFGNEDEYYRRRYTSSGYPGSFGSRPAVEFDMGIRDIDNDSPGIELEFALRADVGPGWSGGPLWLPAEGPAVAGIYSGTEKDELDPRRHVFGGGGGMVDLVKFGLANWRP